MIEYCIIASRADFESGLLLSVCFYVLKAMGLPSTERNLVFYLSQGCQYAFSIAFK